MFSLRFVFPCKYSIIITTIVMMCICQAINDSDNKKNSFFFFFVTVNESRWEWSEYQVWIEEYLMLSYISKMVIPFRGK